jgi:hypothetical protein
MTQLSELTGFDRRTIKDRLHGLKTQQGPGRAILYDTTEALPRLYFPQGQNDVEQQMASAELRRQVALADKAEIDVRVQLGDLVAIEEVSEIVGKEYTYVRARIMAIPTRLAKPLSLESDPIVIKDILHEAMAEALEDLSADKAYEQGGNSDVLSSSEVEGDEGQGAEAASEVKPGGMG